MNRFAPLVLAATVTTEFAIRELHEAQPENPHVDIEIEVPVPSALAAINFGSGTGNREPLARFRWKVFYAEMTKASSPKADKYAMHQALLTTARAMVRDRDLKHWERVMQYDILEYEIKLMHLRTGGTVNCSGALPALAAALGIEDPSSARV
jgi:hypothetical protein